MAHVVGLFVDSSGKLYASVFRKDANKAAQVDCLGTLALNQRIGAGAPRKLNNRIAEDAINMRMIKERLSQLCEQDSCGSFTALLSMSDFDLTRYVRARKLFEYANVHIYRWLLSTDALCFKTYNYSREECYVLAAHLGFCSTTVAIYDCSDGVMECLAVRRASNQAHDVTERCSTAMRLVAELCRSIGWSGTPPRKENALRICVCDETQNQVASESAIRAALQANGLSADTMPHILVPALPIDIGRGLATYAGVMEGEVEDMLAMPVTWFSVALAGTRGRLKLINHDTTIPTSKTELIDYSVDDCDVGALTHVIVSVPDDRELCLPLPESLRQLADGSHGTLIEVAIDIDCGYSLTCSIKEKNTERQQQIDLFALLNKAKERSLYLPMPTWP